MRRRVLGVEVRPREECAIVPRSHIGDAGAHVHPRVSGASYLLLARLGDAVARQEVVDPRLRVSDPGADVVLTHEEEPRRLEPEREVLEDERRVRGAGRDRADQLGPVADGVGRGGRVGVSLTLSTTGSLVATGVSTEDMLDEFSTV